MKKFFILLLSAGTSIAAFANGDPCQAQLDAINARYNRAVAGIRANAHLTATDRDYKIAQTERSRQTKLDEARRACASGVTYNNNKGNHKGWTKGKGNPHKDPNWKENKKNGKED